MLTFVFLLVFGGILIGFVVYLTMFSGGRKKQAGKAEVNAQHEAPRSPRGSGQGDN